MMPSTWCMQSTIVSTYHHGHILGIAYILCWRISRDTDESNSFAIREYVTSGMKIKDKSDEMSWICVWQLFPVGDVSSIPVVVALLFAELLSESKDIVCWWIDIIRRLLSDEIVTLIWRYVTSEPIGRPAFVIAFRVQANGSGDIVDDESK